MKWIFATLISIIGFFSPIKFLFFATGTMVTCDMITGIIKAIKKKEKIHSSRMINKVWNSIVYFIGIALSFIIEQFTPGIPVSKIFVATVLFVEFKSNIENIEEITGIEVMKKLSEVFKSIIK